MSVSNVTATIPKQQPAEALELRAVQPLNEAELIVALLRGQPFKVPDETDWEVLLNLATKNGVLLLLHKSFEEMGVEMPYFFRDAAGKAGDSAERLAADLQDLLALFAAAGIGVLPLKGPALSLALYGDALLRSSVDLDLLVRREEFKRAGELLIERGFTARPHSDGDRLLVRNELSVELHHRIASQRYCRIDVERVWSRSLPGEFRGQPIRLMCDDDLVFYLCSHELRRGVSPLVCILDVARSLCGRCARGCRELWERAWSGALSHSRTDGRELDIQPEPGILERRRQGFGSFAPTGSDVLWAELNGIQPEIMQALRPFRLLKKHGAHGAGETLFPPGL
jgi:hypothetical protein